MNDDKYNTDDLKTVLSCHDQLIDSIVDIYNKNIPGSNMNANKVALLGASLAIVVYRSFLMGNFPDEAVIQNSEKFKELLMVNFDGLWENTNETVEAEKIVKH